MELKLDNGDGVSVPTGNLDHETLFTAPLSDMIINYNRFKNLTELAPKPVGLYQTEGESIRHVLTPKEKKIFKEKLLKEIEIYMKTAKPASFEEATESFLESSSKATITPEQIDRIKQLILDAKKNKE